MSKTLRIKSINARRDVEEVSSIFGSPDIRWTYTDAAGCEHYCIEDGTYPTLDIIYEGCGDADHDIDCRGNSHYECQECREWIVPGRSYLPLLISGPTTYTLILVGKNVQYEAIMGEKDYAELKKDGMYVKHSDISKNITTISWSA